MEESKLAELALADDAIWEDLVSLTSETVYGYEYPTSCLSQTIQNADYLVLVSRHVNRSSAALIQDD